jgi:hypothetical protein
MIVQKQKQKLLDSHYCTYVTFHHASVLRLLPLIDQGVLMGN